ncbi:unnamed protein product [Brassica rapa]|uniref:Uncharacterized protein n=1 Tax=Brassica campestris TaxID=3711 RepID=A0A8D9HNE8_BRACM|nr:unnamed protein product [Brassica rapa]
MIQSPSVEVIRVERSRKESRNRAVLDLEEMKEDEQSIRGDQNEGKYAHPVTISLSIPGVCLENEQELPGSDGTQRREDLLGILPTRPQSRLYHVTDPSEFLQ